MLFSLVIVPGFSQPKPAKKEKPPTAKEMEDMQKEMDKAMREISPEDKKMMDSMGFKMPSMPTMPKMTDKQIATAMEDADRIVPVRDEARIGKISKQPLATSAIPAYLSTVHADIVSKLDPYVNESGEKIYQWLKKEYNSASATGNGAAGFWIMGKQDIALYIMSKACKDDPADADNLNNFSAMLTMAGAEQHAVPLLQNLNTKFPKNTTILNNLGQAWFGLGEITLAEKYLDSCIRIYSRHSQANATKSRIQESKGDKSRAVESLRNSIHEGYTMDKENRLNKLGYKLKGDDLNWDKPMPADPLGLEKFNWPDYPLNVDECAVLKPQWRKFIDACQDEINKLRETQKRLEEELTVATQKRMKKVIQAANNGVMVDPMPRFAPKAIIKLKYLVDGKDGKFAYEYQTQMERVASVIASVEGKEGTYSENLELLRKKYEPLFGEGKPNPMEQACADENKLKNEFLNDANATLMVTYRTFLNFMRRTFNDRMYYCQYTQWPEEFELSKVQTQISWLNLIKDQKVKFLEKSAWCQRKEIIASAKKDSLGQFEDMHCVYHSETNFGFGSISSDCSKLTAKLDLKLIDKVLGIDVIKLKLVTKEGDRDDETIMDQFQSFRVEMGPKKTWGYGSGPIRAEAKLGVAGFLEIGKNGISDAGVIGTAEINVGTNIIKQMDGTKVVGTKGPDGKMSGDNSMGPIKDQNITIVGASAKISLMAGPSMEGKGILSGMKWAPK